MAERAKERDTACCIRKDRAGCVQSPKTECSKVGEPEGDVVPGGGGGGATTGQTPKSNWVRIGLIFGVHSLPEIGLGHRKKWQLRLR